MCYKWFVRLLRRRRIGSFYLICTAEESTIDGKVGGKFKLKVIRLRHTVVVVVSRCPKNATAVILRVVHTQGMRLLCVAGGNNEVSGKLHCCTFTNRARQ